MSSNTPHTWSRHPMANFPDSFFEPTFEGQYQYDYAPPVTPIKGINIFEEGVATDTDVPIGFGRGAFEDGLGTTATGWAIKDPYETSRERAHVGSASWVEAPIQLDDFIFGAMADHPTFEVVVGSEQRLRPYAPSRIA